jgi:hypothetical protein
MGEWMYRSTYSLPRYHFELKGQLHAPAALLPGKIRRGYKLLVGKPEGEGTLGRHRNR